jgi:uncharacterized membrane protein
MMIAVGALNRTEGSVFELLTVVVACLGVASLASFLFLIDYSARPLRPVRIVALVCDEGMQVIRGVYPELDAGPAEATDERADGATLGRPARTLEHIGRSQVVLAVDLEALMVLACRHEGIIEVVPQVGDFVATDEPL